MKEQLPAPDLTQGWLRVSKMKKYELLQILSEKPTARQGAAAREKSCVCPLLLILLSSATAMDLLRREGLLPVCWICSLLGVFVGLGMSCPAGSNRAESVMLMGKVMPQHDAVLPLGHIPKPPRGSDFME